MKNPSSKSLTLCKWILNHYQLIIMTPRIEIIMELIIPVLKLLIAYDDLEFIIFLSPNA